jgi:hypothetical protein
MKIFGNALLYLSSKVGKVDDDVFDGKPASEVKPASDDEAASDDESPF